MIPIYELPFYIGSTHKPDNNGYPGSLPVELYYDADLKMLRLKNTSETKSILNAVYKQGSLVDGSFSSESGRAYVHSVIDYIKKWTDGKLNSKILEIGPGKGIILKLLKETGYTNLLGIEPGDHRMLDGMEGIPIVRNFFPNGIVGSYDIVLHFAVWEHIEDPITFFRNCIEAIADGGKMIFAVPNCSPYISTGDLSMIIHEHYSYFTEESVKRIAKKCGVTLLDVAVLHGMLMGVVLKDPNVKTSDVQQVLEEAKRFEDRYSTSVQLNLNRLRTFSQRFSEQHHIAIYAPARAINALSVLKLNEVRLVDDSSEMWNRYLPGFINHIESFEDMCSNPPQVILIYSSTFGDQIKNKCAADTRLSNTEVASISELFLSI
jgi:SAM-dependent methyltransferase